MSEILNETIIVEEQSVLPQYYEAENNIIIEYPKQDCNKLIIVKSPSVGEDGLYTYGFQWCYNENIIYNERKKIDVDENGSPKETYDIDGLIEHKIFCCLNIDKSTFQIEVTY